MFLCVLFFCAHVWKERDIAENIREIEKESQRAEREAPSNHYAALRLFHDIEKYDMRLSIFSQDEPIYRSCKQQDMKFDESN